MKWSELKPGDVLYELVAGGGVFLLLDNSQGNVYLNLVNGEVSNTGVPLPNSQMKESHWKLEPRR